MGLPPSLPESNESHSVISIRGRGEGKYLRIHGVSVFMWIAFVPIWAFSLLGLYLLANGIANTHAVADYIAGGTMSALAPLGLLSGVWAARPLVITKRQVRIPGLIRTKRIDVPNVAGVGLWYMRRVAGRGGAQGWSLVLVEQSGDPVFIERIIVAAWSTTVNRPFVGDDAARLGRTRAGRKAIAIHDWIVQQQGPDGPLASKALQKEAHYSRWPLRQTYAWWSPDGQIGAATGAPLQATGS